MALLENRLIGAEIVPVSDTNFETVSEAAYRDNKPQQKQVASLLNSNSNNRPRTLVEDVMGMFTSTLCNGLMPYDLRLENLLSGLLQQLGLGYDLGLGCLTNMMFIDQLLGRSPFSFLNLRIGFDLSLSKETLLNTLFNNESARFLQQLGYGGRLSNCGLNNMQGLLGGNLGFDGLNLRDRLDMMNMLGGQFGACAGDAYTTQGSNWVVSQIATAGVINQLAQVDPALSAGYIQTMLNNQAYKANTGNVSDDVIYNRSVVLGGMRYAMTNELDPNVEQKLLLLSAIKNSTNNPSIINIESVSTMGITKNVLNALSNSNNVSTSPDTDLNNLLNGLYSLDPNWNKVDNTINYSTVSNNDRISILAAKTVNGSIVDTSLDVNKPLPILTDIQTINILSNVNKQTEAVNNASNAQSTLSNTNTGVNNNIAPISSESILNSINKFNTNNSIINLIENSINNTTMCCNKKLCMI